MNESKNTDAPTEAPVAASGSGSGESVTRQMVEELHRVVVRGQRYWKALILMEAIGLTIAAPLGYLWLVFLIDNVIHLSVTGRVLANAVFFVVVAGLVYRLRLRWRRARFTEDQVALAIEKRTPGGIENRLINALQLAREADAGQAPMSQLVIGENYRFLHEIHLQQSAESNPAMVRIGVAAVLVLAGLLFWTVGRERFANAATRIFLPFADVAPIYQTVLTVAPGNATVAAGDTVEITVSIEGRVPKDLLVLSDDGAEQRSDLVKVAAGARSVVYSFDAVRRSTAYCVRGNDYTTPHFRIVVPTPFELDRLSGVYDYPDYTRIPDTPFEGLEGDLEALNGTRAASTFLFNQPVSEAWIVFERASEAAAAPPVEEADRNPAAGVDARLDRVALTRSGPRSFSGEIVFEGVVGYQLESRDERAEPVWSREYTLRCIVDEPPELALSGIHTEQEILIDSVVPLKAEATDDYGLAEVGLFYRSARASDGTGGAVAEGGAPLTWQAINSWPVEEPVATFAAEPALVVGVLNAVEGDELELALRARDTDPLKQGVWTTGRKFKLLITSPGAALQLTYERILQDEAALRELIAGHERQVQDAETWLAKLASSSGLRWDDETNLDALSEAMKVQARSQSALRQRASEAAREMSEQAESLRLSVGLLADTEMVRCIRILEAVPKREDPQSKRVALADARLTQERCIRSLNDILNQYVRFREDWELTHMSPFTRMLAERQARMGEGSLTYADLSVDVVGDAQRRAVSRRQLKLLELAGLAQTAFSGLVKFEDAVGAIMTEAFGVASASFDDTGLKDKMREASELLASGRWREAESQQATAAADLDSIYRALRAAQTRAAKLAIEGLEELAESSVEAQEELKKLQAGSDEEMLDYSEEELDLEEIIRLRSLAESLKKRHELDQDDKRFEDYQWDDSMAGALAGGRPEDPDFSILKLAEKPGGQRTFPESSDLEGNRMQIKLIEERFEDLVGDLLEEADDLRENYETYNLNKAGQGVEEGNIGKQAGDLNSVSAAAATGNMKPPTHNFGGASRIGRQGARAHGLVVGNESINRRGRDEAQEGQMEVADQSGELKETVSDDPQQDSSTGVGGKVVGDKQTSFSTKEAGEWRDDMVERLRDPQKENQIVERKGKPLDHRAAEMMRDLDSQQEQVIARIKALKKELDQLYLPTDHLDDIMEQLAANLDRLRDKPSEELFRKQVEQLDKLKSTVVVFNRPSSEYEQTLVRQQALRGRILDEPASPTIPGYEDAVKRYYEKLSAQ